MRRLVTLIAAAALLVGGTSLAVACVGGASGHDNAGHDQYNPKPGCGPWKTDGYAGGSGYHFGQPPKDHSRGDCPKPPCDDRYGRFSGYGSSQHGDDCNDCGDNHFSGYGSGGGGKGDCNSSSADVSPVELSRT